MNYRDEEDIFEEDVVFDQAGLLSSARRRGKSAIRRVSSGRCAMLSKTLALCGAFFGLGLSFALPGPATPVPPSDFTDNETSGKEHIYRCLGFMLGSMLGGMLLDRFNRLFLVFLALLVCAILVAMVPWTGITWLLRSDLILLGATMGFLLTGGNVLCLDLWAQNSRPFMQALHFSFSLGAFLAPLIARPLSPMLATVAPTTLHPRLPRAVDIGFAEAANSSAIPLLSMISSESTTVLQQELTVLKMNTSDSSIIQKTTKQETSAPTSSPGSSISTSHKSLVSQVSHAESLLTKSSSSNILSSTSNLQPTTPTGHAGFSVSASSTSSPISTSSFSPTSSTSSTLSSTSSAGSLILAGNTNSFKSAENTSSTASVSSTTASPRSSHHKSKPRVNIGTKLDKSQNWDGIRVGNPPADDVKPIISTKAPMTSTSSSTSTTSTTSTTVSLTASSSTIVNRNESNASSSTSSAKPSLLEKKIEDPKSVFEVPNSAFKEKQNMYAPSESKAGVDARENSTISNSAASKQAQPSTSSSTDRIPTMSTKPRDSFSISSTTSSVSPSKTAFHSPPSVLSPPSEPLPKSLTLTEKNSSNLHSPVVPKPFSTDVSSPSAMLVTTPIPKSTLNETHFETTSAPRRHHSKPSSYDNDTEEIHTVMDEVADRAQKYGLSRIQLSYLLVAVLLLVVSLLFLGFLCFNPRDPRSRSEEDVGGGRSNVVRPRWIRIMLTSLMMLVLAMSSGVQYSYGHLLVMFAMHSPLSFSYSTASALTATFWGAVTSTRLACILLASALSPGALLVISVVLTSVATWLVVALAAQSAAALWVGAVLVAVGTASILPSSFLWMQQHVHVSHHVAGMLVMGPAMGEMLFPHLSQHVMMGVGPAGLLHLSGLLSLAVIALWAAAWRVARHPCTSLCNRADPAEHSYQLASQTDEDDLLDLTMSPVTHRSHSNVSVARRSSHANGNGMHRSGT